LVRLAGCNLECSYCDTPYAKEEGYKLSLDQVYNKICATGCRLVLITGGEPLLQEEVYPLATRLLAAGYQVLLETNGSLDISRVPGEVVKIMDLKCPESLMAEHTRWENLHHLTPQDQVKFVISSRNDYLWATHIIKRYGLRHNVLMGVAYGRLEPKQLVGWILEDNLPVRFQLQIHKYIWGPNARGV